MDPTYNSVQCEHTQTGDIMSFQADKPKIQVMEVYPVSQSTHQLYQFLYKVSKLVVHINFVLPFLMLLSSFTQIYQEVGEVCPADQLSNSL